MFVKIENMVCQNSKFPSCVDGREPVVYIEYDKNRNKWAVRKDDKILSEAGPQFLGASLLFVRALQKVAYIKLDEAFDLVEKASQELGLGLQIHLDDHHGKVKLAEMTDEEIIEWFQKNLTGCGFAKYAWGEDKNNTPDEVIKEAMERRWRVQILTGNHEENGAIINNQKGQTLNTPKASKNGEAKFSTDTAESKEMFNLLGKMIDDGGFAEKASEWNLQTYKKVVVALGGVETADDIETN